MVTRESYEGHPLTKLVIPSVKLAHGAAGGPSFVHQHLSTTLSRRLIFLLPWSSRLPISVTTSREPICVCAPRANREIVPELQL